MEKREEKKKSTEIQIKGYFSLDHAQCTMHMIFVIAEYMCISMLILCELFSVQFTQNKLIIIVQKNTLDENAIE